MAANDEILKIFGGKANVDPTTGRRPAAFYGWDEGDEDEGERCPKCGGELIPYHHLSTKMVCPMCDG